MPSILSAAINDTVGITNRIGSNRPRNFDTVGITDVVTLIGNFVQYDTWRPVPRPDNGLVLVCRTPRGEHDSSTGYTHLALWTVSALGKNEKIAINTPALNGFGWVSFGHPEWSPDGSQVAVWVETSTSYKLMLIDSSGFGN